MTCTGAWKMPSRPLENPAADNSSWRECVHLHHSAERKHSSSPRYHGQAGQLGMTFT